MSEGKSSDSEQLPDVVVHKGRGVSLVWLVPVVALAIGIYLAVDSYLNRGIKIVITYPTAEWVEAGKTTIKFRSVGIGTVDEVRLAKDIGGVELHCTLNMAAAPHLTEGAQFWIVYPRVGAGGISGLGTLLSGAYLSMQAGPLGGKPARVFEGLEDPPIGPDDEGGLRIALHADELYSLNVGSPVYYLQTKVGEIERHELAEDGDGVTIQLYFPEEHKALVRKDSRFWNAGGFEVSARLGHVTMSSASIESMLSGGLAFDSPGKTKSPPAESGDKHWLHPTHEDLATYPYRFGGLRIVVEAPHLGGAAVGDPVSYREMTVGAVISQELTNDSRKLRLHINIQNRYRHIVRSNTVFWNASGISADLGLTGLHVHAESLQALLAGGIAFATPDPPGHLVEEGAVFKLHPEGRDKWLGWDPVLSRGPAKLGNAKGSAKDDEEKPGLIARFFHHEGKSKEASDKEVPATKDAAHRKAHHEKKHGFLSRRHR